MMNDIEEEVMVKPTENKSINYDKHQNHVPAPLYDNLQFLSSIRESLHAIPEVNQECVEQFKQAISSGHYSIDNFQIALKILAG
jgi:flagellar biosynthesis anti-sigma factor FlgM